MTLTYKMELEDWLALNRFYRQTSPEAKKRLWQSQLWLMLAVIATFFSFMVSRRNSIDAVTVFSTLIGGAIIFMVLSKAQEFSFEKQARKAYESEHNKMLRQATTLTITPDHLSTRTSLSESTIKWSMVENLWTTDEHIFILLSGNTALIIANRAFESEEQREQCIELLEQYHTVVYA
jgi:hypothetical protein